jgi:DNA replication protein DnaC
MLTQPTLEKLQQLKLTGMVQALMEQLKMPEITELSFDERLGLLVDREITHRDDRRLTNRLRTAKLRQNACIEDVDYRHPRGLDKSVITRLATCQWVRDRHNVLITGPTGIGKTWLACALGHQACRDGLTALYLRLPRLLQELPVAKGDGRYVKLMGTLAKTDVLILDDWALAPLNDANRRDLLEVLEDRHDRRATLITSQLPLEHWQAAIGEPTLADAILDRLVHKAYQIVLKGESRRKRLAAQKTDSPKASAWASGGDGLSCLLTPTSTDNQEEHLHDATSPDDRGSCQRR